MKKLSLLTAALVAIPLAAYAQWQVPTNTIPYGKGQGKVGFGSTTNPGTGTQCLLDTAPPTFGPCGAQASLPLSRIFIGNASSIATSAPLTRDCGIAFTGGNAEITCTKTNNVPFGTAATVNTGTSGATIPLLNAENIWSNTQTIDGAFGSVVTNSLGANTRGLLRLKSPTTGVVGSIQGLSGANTIGNIDIATDGAADSGLIRFITSNSGSSSAKVTLTKEGNIGIGTASPAFASGSLTHFFVSSDANYAVNTPARIAVGGNITNTATGGIGSYGFANTAIGAAEKRVAVISGFTDGATNSGMLTFATMNAGVTTTWASIDKTGLLTYGGPTLLNSVGGTFRSNATGIGGITSTALSFVQGTTPRRQKTIVALSITDSLRLILGARNQLCRCCRL